MARIHSSAIVSPGARLADDVEVGPYCVVEPDVEIGAGTVLREHVVIRRYTTLGKGNMVDAHAVLGGWPQDVKFKPESVTYLRIGDGNTFREGVTISRATTPGGATVIGSRTYWMTAAHAGHDSVVHDETILINGSAFAGHTELGRKAILSAHTAIHQFCWVGEMSMGQGNASGTQHVPPFVMWAKVNEVVGLNVVGMRRAGFTREERAQVQEAFSLLYRNGLPVSKALERMDACTDWGAPATTFRNFVRRVHQAAKPHIRGLIRPRHAATQIADE
jgi:UDP-N-acetylglucosamine acyltransferase